MKEIIKKCKMTNTLEVAVCPYCLKKIKSNQILEVIDSKGDIKEQGASGTYKCNHCAKNFNVCADIMFLCEVEKTNE